MVLIKPSSILSNDCLVLVIFMRNMDVLIEKIAFTTNFIVWVRIWDKYFKTAMVGRNYTIEIVKYYPDIPSSK